jgi:hypothetical protein
MVSDRSNGIYRSLIAALIGLVLSGASPPPANPTERNQSDSKRPTRAQFERAIVALVAQKPETKDPGCQPGEDNRQSDLCAQWKAADAASGSMWAAIVGLAIGAATLIFAWRAAHWAKKAAEQTSRNADVTEKGLTAYLSIENVVIHSEALQPLAFECTLRNDGQTPASKVLVDYRLSAISPSDPTNKILISQESLTTNHRVSGQLPVIIPPIPFKNQIWPPSIDERIEFFLFLNIKIKWDDVFGKSHKRSDDFNLSVRLDSFIGSYRMITSQDFSAIISREIERRRTTA